MFTHSGLLGPVSIISAHLWLLSRQTLAAVLLAAIGAAAAQAQQVSLSIADLDAPGFRAKALKAALGGVAGSELTLDIGELTLRGHTWRNARVHCSKLRLDSSLVECGDGILDAGEKIPLSFSYSRRNETLDVALRPASGESWRLSARFAKPGTALTVDVDNGRVARLASWLPATVPAPRAGTLKGTVRYAHPGGVTAQLTVAGLAFSDAGGLHAGDGIGGKFDIEAAQRGDEWHWRATADWSAGEVFWQPLYAKGAGQQLIAEGDSGARQTRVTRGTLRWPSIGEIEFSGAWDPQSGKIGTAGIRSPKLGLGPLYAQFIKPFLEGTALGDMRAEGQAQLALEIADSSVRAADVRLTGMSLEDNKGRFALFGVSGQIPWRRDAASRASIAISGGEVWRLPFGQFTLPLNMKGTHFAVDKLEVPLLDARLTVSDFSAGPAADGWRWSFGGGLTPVSLERFTQSLGLPAMHGSLSGVIPRMTYERSTLTVDGALLFKVFDGTVVAKAVRLSDPFGKVPRMQAELDMRNLDLDLLTRTFSFGNITGRIDARVSGLELTNWQPVTFDARVESSAGDYPRKISQTAVQNISALGGAGAAAAIQRSFLGFFEQFGYQKLGLSCKLRNNVCEMGGAEDAPQGYVIVKGGGVPAITVIGYNRHVSWQELTDRLKRIMQDNVRVIVE